MRTQKFALEIEHLLLSGAIQNAAILQLHRLLTAYEQGYLDAVVMQRAIDQHKPSRIEPCVIPSPPPLLKWLELIVFSVFSANR